MFWKRRSAPRMIRASREGRDGCECVHVCYSRFVEKWEPEDISQRGLRRQEMPLRPGYGSGTASLITNCWLALPCTDSSEERFEDFDLKKSCIPLLSGWLYATAVNQIQVDELPSACSCLQLTFLFFPFSFPFSFCLKHLLFIIPVNDITKKEKSRNQILHAVKNMVTTHHIKLPLN